MTIALDEQNSLTLTDTQRRKFLAIVEENPTIGTRRALVQAGITVQTWRASDGRRNGRRPPSRLEVQDLLNGDPAMRAAYQEARHAGDDDENQRLKLDQRSLWEKVAAIVHNDASPSQWRAVTYAFAIRHGIRDEERVRHEHEHTGEVTVDHDYRSVLEKLERYGVVQRGPAAALDAAQVALLPPRAD